MISKDSPIQKRRNWVIVVCGIICLVSTMQMMRSQSEFLGLPPKAGYSTQRAVYGPPKKVINGPPIDFTVPDLTVGESTGESIPLSLPATLPAAGPLRIRFGITVPKGTEHTRFIVFFLSPIPSPERMTTHTSKMYVWSPKDPKRDEVVVDIPDRKGKYTVEIVQQAPNIRVLASGDVTVE